MQINSVLGQREIDLCNNLNAHDKKSKKVVSSVVFLSTFINFCVFPSHQTRDQTMLKRADLTRGQYPVK